MFFNSWMWHSSSRVRKQARPLGLEQLEARAVPAVLVWSDEFNGPVGSAPSSSWTHDLGGGGWGNHELEVYTNSLQNASIVADPAATDGKALAIRAIRQSDGSYTSARLNTAQAFNLAYGRFEARAKLPYGQGMWPAFWMLGSNIGSVGWPNSGEIDVMENIGREPSIVHGSMHGPGYSGGHSLTAGYSLPGGQQFKDAYHLFSVDWTPTSVRFSVDDHLYETRTRADLPGGTNWVFDHSFFLLLNLAVGGDWPGNPDGSTVFPQTYLVDYVRVYADVPNGWSSTDIGGPGRAGGASFDSASGTWTVAGSGADIWGMADQFHFVSWSLVGDGSVTARVSSLPNTDPWAKAGVMVRNDLGAGSAFADMVVTPGNGVNFQWRSTAGAPANGTQVTGLSAPVSVKLVRSGDDFSGYYSTDGLNWTQVGDTQTIPMNSTAQAGLAVTAHNNGTLATVTLTHVSLLPGGWADADIANPGRPGSAQFDSAGGTWTVAGSGSDIWGTSDQFHLASETLTGDGTLVARVTGLTNTNAVAKAGVMFRDSADPSAMFADVVVTPGQGVKFEWRNAPGGQAELAGIPCLSAPVWVMLLRTGNDFTGYTSSDGVNWTQLGATQTIAMNPTALTGLAVTAHDNSVLATALFTNVSLLPAGWVDAEVGSPGLPGYAYYDTPSDTWTVAGSGSDIWGSSDQFHFVSQGLAGDGYILARVASLANTDPWAKAGVMFRDSADPAAPFVDVLATPGNGVAFEWRTSYGSQPQDMHVVGISAPVWLLLTRTGDDFSGYYSSDGVNWTQVGSDQIVVMSATAGVGLAVTAHNNGLLNAATFDNVQVFSSGGYRPGIPPSSGGREDQGLADAAALLEQSMAVKSQEVGPGWRIRRWDQPWLDSAPR